MKLRRTKNCAIFGPPCTLGQELHQSLSVPAQISFYPRLFPQNYPFLLIKIFNINRGWCSNLRYQHNETRTRSFACKKVDVGAVGFTWHKSHISYKFPRNSRTVFFHRLGSPTTFCFHPSSSHYVARPKAKHIATWGSCIDLMADLGACTYCRG